MKVVYGHPFNVSFRKDPQRRQTSIRTQIFLVQRKKAWWDQLSRKRYSTERNQHKVILTSPALEAAQN